MKRTIELWSLSLALLTLLTLLGCSRAEPQPRVGKPRQPDQPAVAAAPVAPALGAASTVPSRQPFARPAAELVIAIGDLHGDLAAARRALRLAGVIDEQDAWVGGDTVVVQTGDILDRGDDERAILDLTDALHAAAVKTGGAFLALSGNHELMNVAQDFRYVTPGGFGAFASEGGRDVAFRPAGSFAKRLAERPVVAQVGDNVFVHGGVLPKHVAYGLSRINDEVRAWMLGQQLDPPAIVMAEDGPIWARLYSLETDERACATLKQTLDALGAKRMVVGHTVQHEGITSACDGRVWRIDTGMSHHYGGPVEVLEIRGDAVRARKESTQPAK